MNVNLHSESSSDFDTLVAIARGDLVNHSVVSQLINEGKPEFLELIIFNSNTHDELKFKALRKIVDSNQEYFDFKMKKSLVSRCIKKNNFGNEFYFKSKEILRELKETQKASVIEVIKNHLQYVLDEQDALNDPDFQVISSEINLLKSAHTYGFKLSKEVPSPSFWNYLRMVNWASFLEHDDLLNQSLNDSVLEELDHLLTMDQWHLLDEQFVEPKSIDTLVYCSVHLIHIELNYDISKTLSMLEQANNVLENFESIVKQLEVLVEKVRDNRTANHEAQLQAIQTRIEKRLASERQRPETLASSPLVYKEDASINNRWN